jgi:hypothetical protein
VVPGDAAVLLEYADRARARFAALRAERLPAMVTHGDLIGGNVLYVQGAVSGVQIRQERGLPVPGLRLALLDPPPAVDRQDGPVQGGALVGGEWRVGRGEHHLEEGPERRRLLVDRIARLTRLVVRLHRGQVERVEVRAARDGEAHDLAAHGPGQTPVLGLGVEDQHLHPQEAVPQGQELEGVGLPRAGRGHHRDAGVGGVRVVGVEQHRRAGAPVEPEQDALPGGRGHHEGQRARQAAGVQLPRGAHPVGRLREHRPEGVGLLVDGHPGVGEEAPDGRLHPRLQALPGRAQRPDGRRPQVEVAGHVEDGLGAPAEAVPEAGEVLHRREHVGVFDAAGAPGGQEGALEAGEAPAKAASCASRSPRRA